jgi:7,8-dihydro-6-hydroxymethylpterin-pyrophosphokinase
MVEEILSIVREQSRTYSSISQTNISQTNFLNATQEVNEELRNHDLEVPADEIESRLRKLIVDFRVPEAEAIRSVRNYFLQESGVKIKRG